VAELPFAAGLAAEAFGVALHSAAAVLYDALIIVGFTLGQAISTHVSRDLIEATGRAGGFGFFSDAAAAPIRNLDPIVALLILAVRDTDRKSDDPSVRVASPRGLVDSDAGSP
jgi:hypothetical protein